MLDGLVNKLLGFQQNLNSYLISEEILDLITLLKREDLFNGKRGDNSDITPNYEDRPAYAGWYLEWKNTLSTYRLRNGTPDLYIDGTFHNSLYTEETKTGVYTTQSDNSQPFMLEVVQLHDNGTLLDLTDFSLNIVAAEIENYVLTNFNF